MSKKLINKYSRRHGINELRFFLIVDEDHPQEEDDKSFLKKFEDRHYIFKIYFLLFNLNLIETEEIAKTYASLLSEHKNLIALDRAVRTPDFSSLKYLSFEERFACLLTLLSARAPEAFIQSIFFLIRSQWLEAPEQAQYYLEPLVNLQSKAEMDQKLLDLHDAALAKSTFGVRLCRRPRSHCFSFKAEEVKEDNFADLSVKIEEAIGYPL